MADTPFQAVKTGESGCGVCREVAGHDAFPDALELKDAAASAVAVSSLITLFALAQRVGVCYSFVIILPLVVRCPPHPLVRSNPEGSRMLTFTGASHPDCRRPHRREFLRIGALGMGGLTLPTLLRQQARAEAPSRPKSIIYIVLSGGPSHIDMWDPKPDAPAEYRGPFHPIATRLPGMHLSELLPRQAAMMDQLTLLRGIRSVENDHFLSEVYTGLPRSAGNRPAFGSVVSRLAERRSDLPPYVCLAPGAAEQFEYEKPYYAGAGHAPFRPMGEALEDLAPAPALDRLRDRRQLLRTFDTMRRDLDRSGTLNGLDQYQAAAFDIISSPRVRDAFDLSREPDRVIASYGRGKFTHQTVKTILYDWDARKFVLARRLVEAGVRIVTLRIGAWDHHSAPTADIFLSLSHMVPALDWSLTALCNDLKARGMDEDVLVVVLGEFGRTPRITPLGPGREHWADAGCAVFFGGGLRMGQVIGATDSRAERARTGSITFQNILATIYQTLGIDLRTQLTDFNGRPQNLLNDCQPIGELIG
jgi:hypothetical protein